MDELQKREVQFRDVIDKYKTQQESKNRELVGLKKQLKQVRGTAGKAGKRSP